MTASEVVGPVDADEIRRYHRASVIDDDAWVWHAGFRGWACLAETATFRELVGGRRSTPRCERTSVVDLTGSARPVARRSTLRHRHRRVAGIV